MVLCTEWMLECIRLCAVYLWTDLIDNWTKLEYCIYFNSSSNILSISPLFLNSTDQAVCNVVYKVSCIYVLQSLHKCFGLPGL